MRIYFQSKPSPMLTRLPCSIKYGLINKVYEIKMHFVWHIVFCFKRVVFVIRNWIGLNGEGKD